MPNTKFKGHRMDTQAKKMMQGHPSMTPMQVVKQGAKNRKVSMNNNKRYA